MLWSVWYRFFLWFPVPTVSFPSLWTTHPSATFMFHGFFSSLRKSNYLSLFSLSFIFTLWSARTPNSSIWQYLRVFCFVLFCFLPVFVFYSINSMFDILVRIKWYFWALKPQRILQVTISRKILVCAYTICLYGQIFMYYYHHYFPGC